ncbi:unnamed protein product [Ceratitis capitata]|uniref:(Mediterranean fruit fly) hypothetical protein n=1 Tax=Ceratitis capitata TaxID=7213 RepID=A0A811UAP1_CERCA|nr:unnamed protein product [Ceratitis capitata]
MNLRAKSRNPVAKLVFSRDNKILINAKSLANTHEYICLALTLQHLYYIIPFLYHEGAAAQLVDVFIKIRVTSESSGSAIEIGPRDLFGFYFEEEKPTYRNAALLR